MAKIVVVGTGPAGLISGNYLIREKNTVVIYEKNKEIVSSPCGEAVSVKTLQNLEECVGFDSEPFISRKIDGLKMVFPENNFALIHNKGVILNRVKWMEGLSKHFEEAGGKILFDEDVKTPESLKCDYLVGADGPASVVRRLVGCKVEMTPGVQYKIKTDSNDRKFAEFYFDREVNKYFSWIFPKKDCLNVGSAGSFEEIHKLMQKYGISGKILKKEAAPVPLHGTRFQRGNIFLIGDAAGMANSFSGGGMAPIVYASKVLSDCIARGEVSKYESMLREHKAFSEHFYKAKQTILGLTQDKLIAMGKLVNREDISNLPFTRKLKAARHPKIIRDLIIMAKAFREGVEYGW